MRSFEYLYKNGYAKKEALSPQAFKFFNAAKRAKIRKLIPSYNKDYTEAASLLNVNPMGFRFIPARDLKRVGINAKPGEQYIANSCNLPFFKPVSLSQLQTNPDSAKEFLTYVKNISKKHPPLPFILGSYFHLPGAPRSELIHELARRFARRRSLQVTGQRFTEIPKVENFDVLYKGFEGAPFSTLNAAHSAPTMGGYSTNRALWFTPHRDVASSYGNALATFRTNPEIKEFASRTATPHLASSVSWEDRISGKARKDAQTIYKGKGGKHFQEDPNDINYETVLPYDLYRWYLQNLKNVRIYDKASNMVYTPLYKKVLM